MDTTEAIKGRRSIRKFKNQDIPDELIDKILTAGIWAPSGMNNQPWRFAVIRDRVLKKELSDLSKDSDILKNASVIIPVFLDNDVAYNNIKDYQTIGACIQNMLLEIYNLGLAGVWIGEIINDGIRKLCQAPKAYDLMAIIAIGYGDEINKGKRSPLDKVVFIRK